MLHTELYEFIFSILLCRFLFSESNTVLVMLGNVLLMISVFYALLHFAVKYFYSGQWYAWCTSCALDVPLSWQHLISSLFLVAHPNTPLSLFLCLSLSLVGLLLRRNSFVVYVGSLATLNWFFVILLTNFFRKEKPLLGRYRNFPTSCNGYSKKREVL